MRMIAVYDRELLQSLMEEFALQGGMADHLIGNAVARRIYKRELPA